MLNIILFEAGRPASTMLYSFVSMGLLKYIYIYIHRKQSCFGDEVYIRKRSLCSRLDRTPSRQRLYSHTVVCSHPVLRTYNYAKEKRDYRSRTQGSTGYSSWTRTALCWRCGDGGTTKARPETELCLLSVPIRLALRRDPSCWESNYWNQQPPSNSLN